MPRDEGSCFFAVLLFPSNYLAATDRIPIARKPVDRFCGMLLSVLSVGAKTRAAAWLACVVASYRKKRLKSRFGSTVEGKRAQ